MIPSPQFWGISKVLKGLIGKQVSSGVGDSRRRVESSWISKGACTVPKHAWDIPSHALRVSFYVKSPSFGCDFLVCSQRKVIQSVAQEGVSSAILDFSGANWFLGGGRLSRPWIFCLDKFSQLLSGDMLGREYKKVRSLKIN